MRWSGPSGVLPSNQASDHFIDRLGDNEGGARPPLSEDQRTQALAEIVCSDRERFVAAAHVLSEDPSTRPALLELLENERRIDQRHAILYALTWHADLRDWYMMILIFADANEAPLVRGQAAEALSYAFYMVSRDSEAYRAAVDALIAGLEDPSPEVRYCAVNALGTTQDRALIPVIARMLDDHTPVPGWLGTVADEAARALDWINPSTPTDP